MWAIEMGVKVRRAFPVATINFACWHSIEAESCKLVAEDLELMHSLD